MNTKISQNRLKHLIQSFASRSQEARQVAGRLREVFPSRYRALHGEYRKGSADHAQRGALLDQRYLSAVNELITIRSEALEARIQYETHLMLFKARQSDKTINSLKSTPMRLYRRKSTPDV